MELIVRDKKIFELAHFNNYIFRRDCGTLHRCDYNERSNVVVENKVTDIKILKDTIVISKYDNGIEIAAIHTDSLRKRTLIKSADVEHLFANPENAYADCIMSFEYHEGKLLAVLKEDKRRFMVAINILTAETDVIGEWSF